MTFPLLSEVYKPKSRLKEGDEYKSKPKIAGEMIKKLKELGFKIKIVLADSEYGESESNFVSILEKEKLDFVLAIRRVQKTMFDVCFFVKPLSKKLLEILVGRQAR